jgi:polysaccharide biosynthesis transport protein
MREVNLPPAIVGSGGSIDPYTDPGQPYEVWEAPAPPSQFRKRLFTALRRFWWLIIPVTLVGGWIGATANLGPANTYLAEGKIWAGSDQAGAAQGGGPIQSTQLANTSGWVDLIRSYTVVDVAVEKMRLYLIPLTREDTTAVQNLIASSSLVPGRYVVEVDSTGAGYMLLHQGKVVERGHVGDSIGRTFGILWAPDRAILSPGREVTFTLQAPRMAASIVLSGLVTEPTEGSSFIKLTMRGPTPAHAASVLNIIMDEFQKLAVELKKGNLEDMEKITVAQLDSAREAMQEAAAAYTSYRQKNATKVSGMGVTDPTVVTYLESEKERNKVSRDADQLETIIAASKRGDNIAVDEILSLGSLGNGATELKSAITDLAEEEKQLRALRKNLQDAHPNVSRQMAVVEGLRKNTIPRLANEQLRILRKQVALYDSRMQRDQAQLVEGPAVAVETQRLENQLKTASDFFYQIQNRYNMARLASSSVLPEIRVLDKAAPIVEPGRALGPIFILGGLGSGFGLGLVVAMILVGLDRRLREPTQVAEELGLDVIGAAPRVMALNPGGTRAAHPEVAMQTIEAIRTLRLSIQHSFNGGPVILTVSSPGPGDGKSLLTANLALSFAEAGFRTLLIDGDIRRGRVDRMFKVDRRPGLVDCLAGNATTDQIIRNTEAHPGLHVLPSGTRQHRAPELLTSSRLPELLGQLTPMYEVILVDSPPMGAGIDAYALAVATGNLVTVVRTGITDLELAKKKLKLAYRLPIRVLGAVVNDLRGKGAFSEYTYLTEYEIAEEQLLPSSTEPAPRTIVT